MAEADKTAGTGALSGVIKTRSPSLAVLTCPPAVLPPVSVFTSPLLSGDSPASLNLGALGPAASVTAPVIGLGMKVLSRCSVLDADLGVILTLTSPTPLCPSHR